MTGAREYEHRKEWDDPVVGYVIIEYTMDNGEKSLSAQPVTQSTNFVTVGEDDQSEYHTMSEDSKVVGTFPAPPGIFSREREDTPGGDILFEKYVHSGESRTVEEGDQ